MDPAHRTAGLRSQVALATPHYRATEIALEAIEAGAGAVEAALTAAAALTVVYPHQCSIGGDLVALVRDPSGTVRSYVSVGATARDLDVDAVPRPGGKMPARGIHTVTVPGVVAGWAAIAGSAGRPALSAALVRAAALAEDGVIVAPGLGRALAETWSVIGTDPGMRAVFAGADGGPMAIGDRLQQPRLAQTLGALARDPVSFYRGELADRIAAGLSRLGSAITASDLAGHQVDTRPPLSVEAAGREWFVAPPPSQGIAFLALRATTAAGPEAVADLLGRALTAAGIRDDRLADPAFAGLALADFVDGMRPQTGRDRPVRPGAGPERPAGDTVAVTAVDQEGWAISIVQSVYQTFGSGLADPDTGIVLHNRGSAFSAQPEHPAAIRPGARPPHTLMPVMVESPGGDVAALGCQGGRAQPWIMAQLADRLTDPEVAPEAVLGADRWIFGGLDIDASEPTIMMEGRDVPVDVAELAARRGWASVALGRQVDVAGHVQMARRSSGVLQAGTDPRADGRAVVAGPEIHGGINLET